MRSREVVALIAAELGVFTLDSGTEGYYAVRLPDGATMRIFVQAETAVILERPLMAGVAAALRDPERLLDLLLENFSRAIMSAATLTYVRDMDELALSLLLPYEDWDERKLVDGLDAFILECRRVGDQIQRVLFASMSRLPFNNHSIATS
ncbi:MAG: CesT family type III secretion system chaperone [Puniceicoccales bacterium]|jgi:hypothetical protein|nr:CesT family type III secretion system chaperone [Puniceicoccales bacterium]